MTKTIEERLDAHAIACQSVAVDLIYRHPDDDVYSDIETRDAIEAAIIAGWNAAIAAMKTTQAQLEKIAAAADAYYSGEGRSLDAFIDEYLGDLSYGDLPAAIALMEGRSPSRDEAMVEDAHTEHEVSDEYHKRVVGGDHHGSMFEDKRYERDDIYKK